MEKSEDVQQSGSRFVTKLSGFPEMSWVLSKIIVAYGKVRASWTPLLPLPLLGERCVNLLKVKSQPMLRLLEKPLIDIHASRVLQFVETVDPLVSLPLDQAWRRLLSLGHDLYELALQYPRRIYQRIEPSINALCQYALGIWHSIPNPEEWRHVCQCNPIEVCNEWMLYGLTKIQPFKLAVSAGAVTMKEKVQCLWDMLSALTPFTLAVELSYIGLLYRLCRARYEESRSYYNTSLQKIRYTMKSLDRNRPQEQSPATEETSYSENEPQADVQYQLSN